MRLIGPSFTFRRVATMTEFHLGRLETHKKTKELHQTFSVLYGNFDTHWNFWLKARSRRAILLGTLEFLDADFDDSLGDVSATVLSSENRDRSSVVYRTYYPTGRIQESTEAPYEHTQRIIDRITAAHTAYPNAAPQDMVDRVKSTGAEVILGMKALDDQEALIAKHRANMEIARIPLAREYNDNANHLRLLFPGKNRLVESFFLEGSKNDE